MGGRKDARDRPCTGYIGDVVSIFLIVLEKRTKACLFREKLLVERGFGGLTPPASTRTRSPFLGAV